MTTASAPAEATVHDASPVDPAAATDLDDEDARWAAYAAPAEPETTIAATTDAHKQRYDVADDTAAAGAAAAGGAVAAGAAAGGASSTPVASTTAYDTRTTEGTATASSNAFVAP